MAWIVAALTVAMLTAGCGDSGTTTSAAEPTDTSSTSVPTTVAPTTVAPTTTSGALGARGFPEPCPTTSESLNLTNSATYQVFGELPIPLSDGSVALQYIFIGTAWAVGDRLLVTNAHVVDAFNDTAAQGVQLSRALAVQSGTGTVIRLLRAFIHPDYTGLPLNSPDVGLFTSQEVLPSQLTLAPADSVLDLGDDIQIVGFPGDVDEFIRTRPGESVPQATSLLGTVTSRRSHDDTEAVNADTLDVYQHQAPTTPGTSGSSMVHCGLVAGVNNAGTVKLVVSPNPAQQGEFTIQRQAAASNNFGVHVKHIHDLIELFEANALQGSELPVEAAPPPPGSGDPQATGIAGTYTGTVTDPDAQHQFQITIDQQGNVSGTSLWPQTGEFTLTGAVAADGSLLFTDDATERLGFRRGTYQGQIAADGSITGVYFEETQENLTWPFTATRQ